MKLFKDMNQEEAEAHILKYKPKNVVAKPMHNMPLWHDIHQYFKEWFSQAHGIMALPGSTYHLTYDELVKNLQSHFEVQYSPAQLSDLFKMIHIEYKKGPQGHYQFKREDFIKPIVIN